MAEEIDRVLEFIDDYYRHAFQRPKMYFSCPEACEDVIYAIEGLRAVMLDSSGDLYGDYLDAHGFGPSRFITRYKEARGGRIVDDDDFYKQYSEFVMEYVKSGRKPASPPR